MAPPKTSKQSVNISIIIVTCISDNFIYKKKSIHMVITHEKPCAILLRNIFCLWVGFVAHYAPKININLNRKSNLHEQDLNQLLASGFIEHCL